MRSTLELRAVTMLATLALVACGEAATVSTAPDVDAPQHEQTEEAERFAASEETVAATGVRDWQVIAGPADLQSGTIFIKGMTENGKPKVEATLTIYYGEEQDPGSRAIVAYELVVEHPEAVRSQLRTQGTTVTPSVKSPLTTAISNDVVAALVRRMHGVEAEQLPPDAEYANDDGLELGVQQLALTAEQRGERRGLIKSMVDFASIAYVTRDARGEFAGLGDMHGYTFWPQASTNVMKFFDRPNGFQVSLLISFSGANSLADWGRALESQVPVFNYNPLSGGLELTKITAQGFQTRWVNQARNLDFGDVPNDALTVLQRLQDAIAGVGPEGVVEVILVGHSLGGAAASLAGYSIAEWLKHQPVRQKVWVYSFNPPRIGFHNSAWREALSWYQDALIEGGGCTDPAPNQVGYEQGRRCLIMRQFSRRLDPVSSLPLNVGTLQAKSAVWQPNLQDTKVGAGWLDPTLPYCPMYYAPVHLNPHSLDAWKLDAERNLPDAHLDCMYRRM